MQRSPLQPKDPINLNRARERLANRNAQAGMQRLGKALCDPARLEILQALSASPLTVNDLALAIGRAPAATSQHLRVLRELDLVEGARHGTSIHYSLKRGMAAELESILDRLASLPPASGA